MKTQKFILAILAVALFSTVSAQDFKFGVKVGMNVATGSGDLEDNKSLVGLNIGVTGEYLFSDKASVSAELLFSQQGTKFSESEGDYEYTEKFKLNYLNIPILFNYYVIDKLAIKAGIQPGFLLSAKDKWEYSEDGESESGSDDIKDGFNSVDISIPIGISYDITDNIVVDARYNIGVSNVLNEDYWDDGKMKNSVFAISVGYKF